MTATKYARQMGWTKVRVTKLHSFSSSRLGQTTRSHWADRAILDQDGVHYTCVKLGHTWCRTTDYTY